MREHSLAPLSKKRMIGRIGYKERLEKKKKKKYKWWRVLQFFNIIFPPLNLNLKFDVVHQAIPIISYAGLPLYEKSFHK